jgi:hypothetical protein
MESTHRDLLVLACARSGTKYMTRALIERGVNVAHECMGEHGTVSNYFAVDADAYPKCGHGQAHPEGRRARYTFGTVLHQVRHPLAVIPSVVNIVNKENRAWISSFIDIDARLPGPVWAALYWMRWNDLIAHQGPDLTYRIEEIDDIWLHLRHLVNTRCEPRREISKTTNASTGNRKAERLTWEQAANKCGKFTTYALREAAARYGYE